MNSLVSTGGSVGQGKVRPALHIGFQRSGGRGEYEVVGSHSGYTAISLEGWRFFLRWPDGIVRETGLELEPADSGKPRLRSTWSPQFQIGRMVAAMLLLPDPRREYAQTNDSLPVARAKGYVLSRIGFGPDTEFTGVTDQVTIDASFVTLANRAGDDSIGIAQRWFRVQGVYNAVHLLPPSLASLVTEHRDYLASGRPIKADLTSIVASLIKELAGTVGTTFDGDPLPMLEQMLNLQVFATPNLPPPDEIGEEDPEIAVRAASEYRMAKTRGPGAVTFRKDVRAAYNHRCLFCGGRFGDIPDVVSGVDAAHILAWSKYNLDVVINGLSLCKLHHWAFDAALILPVYKGGDLYVSFTELTVPMDQHSKGLLGIDGAPVDPVFLPASKAQWPSEKYLEHLYADLAISFTA